MNLQTKISQLKIGNTELTFNDDGEVTLKQDKGKVKISSEILDIVKETLLKNGNGVITNETKS